MRKFNALSVFAVLMAADATVAGTGETLAQATAVPDTPAVTNGVTMTDQSFHFKKEKIRDEKGAVVGEGEKLPSVKLPLPIPTKTKLAELLTSTDEKDKKAQELLLQAVTDVIYSQARLQINDYRASAASKGEDGKAKPIVASILNYNQLDWNYIANLPKSERGSSVPSDEDMQEFYDLYLEIMPAALQKEKGKIENHIVLFKDGFKKQRAQKQFLQVFKDALDVMAATATEDQMENVAPVWEYYDSRLTRMLKAEETITMDMI